MSASVTEPVVKPHPSASLPYPLPAVICCQASLDCPLGRLWPGASDPGFVMGLCFIPEWVWPLTTPGPASACRDGASVCLPLWPGLDGQTVPREQEGAGSAGDRTVAVPCSSLLVDGGEALESASLHVGSVCPLPAVTAMQVGPPLPALTGQAPPSPPPQAQGHVTSSGLLGCILASSQLLGAGVSASVPGLWFRFGGWILSGSYRTEDTTYTRRNEN